MTDRPPGDHDIYVLLEGRDEDTVAAVEEYFDLETCRETADDYVISEGEPEARVVESWSELRAHLLADEQASPLPIYWSCDQPDRLVILDFTEDAHLIVGYSQLGLSPLEAARMMFRMIEDLGATMGFVGWEEAPPLGGRDEFRKRIENGLTFASYRHDIFH